MRLVLLLLLLILFLLSHPPKIAAESSYVLPYPSFMPGNKFHSVEVVWDKILSFWYFGSFSQFQYNLHQSDQYLVEAKTLFEYKQYVLAMNSLEKSNGFFINSIDSLKSAKEENKDITDKMMLLQNASEKHSEVLQDIDRFTPDLFEWTPEKKYPTLIHIKKNLQEAVEIRRKSYE